MRRAVLLARAQTSHRGRSFGPLAGTQARPVIAVVGGLLTAVCWAIANLTSSRASRMVGGASAMALVSLVGVVAALPLVVGERAPTPDHAPELVWVVASGVGYGAGLLLMFAAYARGKVSIIAPIASTEGAIAATIAISLGAPATALLLVALGVTALGIVLTTLEPGTDASDLRYRGGGYLLLAIGAALAFGVGLYAAGRASESVPLGWIVMSGRLVGALCVALPLLLLGRLRVRRAVLPLVLVSGVLEVAGYLLFTWGARDDIAVAAVLSSQFAVLVAVASHRLGERLAARQWLGVGLAAAGVASVSLLQL